MSFWKKKEKKSADSSAGVENTSPDQATPSPQTEESLSSSTHRMQSIRTALSEGTTIQGKLSFDSPVRIDGKLQGEVFSSDTLYVGSKGTVDADIETRNLIVAGKVKGNIQASETVKLLAGAEVSGKILTQRLAIEEGAVMNASCQMSDTVRDEASVSLPIVRVRPKQEQKTEIIEETKIVESQREMGLH